MTDQWYLRREDGAIFGPTDLDEFVAWAMSGRIGPDDDVSQDQRSWMPAPQLPALDMVWSIVFDDDNVFGPFNVYALIDIAEEHHLSYSTELVHAKTGKRHQLGNILLPLLFAERETYEGKVRQDVAQDMEKSKDSMTSLSYELKAIQEDLEMAQEQVVKKAAENTRLAEKAMENHQRLLHEREAAAEKIEAMESEMHQALEVFKEKEEAIQDLREQVQNFKGLAEARNIESRDFAEELAERTEELSQKTKEVEELEAQVKEQAAGLAAKTDEVSALQTKLVELNEKAESVKDLQPQLDEAKNQLTVKDDRIQELEAAQLELEKQGSADRERLTLLESELDALKSSQQSTLDQLTRERDEAQSALSSLEAEFASFKSETESSTSQSTNEVDTLKQEAEQRVKQHADEVNHLKDELADMKARMEENSRQTDDVASLQQEVASLREELAHARQALKNRDAESAQSASRPSSLIQQALKQKPPVQEPDTDASSESVKAPPSLQTALSGIRRETLKDSKKKNQVVTNYKRQRNAAQPRRGGPSKFLQRRK